MNVYEMWLMGREEARHEDLRDDYDPQEREEEQG